MRGLGSRAGPGPAMGILEKISEIEKEIARTQKNKGPDRRGALRGRSGRGGGGGGDTGGVRGRGAAGPWRGWEGEVAVWGAGSG